MIIVENIWLNQTLQLDYIYMVDTQNDNSIHFLSADR